MLTTQMRKRLEVPHEKGEWVEVRALGWKKLEEAQRVRTENVLKNVRAMGAEVMQSLPQTAEDSKDAADPLSPYDTGILLRAAIVGWSYGEKVRPDTIDDLDPVTADWLAREVLAMCQYGEPERKNS